MEHLFIIDVCEGVGGCGGGVYCGFRVTFGGQKSNGFAIIINLKSHSTQTRCDDRVEGKTQTTRA